MNEALRTWEAWHSQHQPYELQWWKKALARGHSTNDDEFVRIWDERREFVKPRGIVIDIGCGPRPPFAPCIAIDPLANAYLNLEGVRREWWDNVTAYAQPAETIISSLFEIADTVICWNCIDHAIGWRVILDNMRVYGKRGARFAVATDFDPPYVGHPGFDRDEFMREIELRFSIVESREKFDRQLALIMEGKDEKDSSM